MAYSFKVTDRATHQVTYVDDVDGMRNLVDRGIDASIEVVDEAGIGLNASSSDRMHYDQLPPDSPREFAEIFVDVVANVPVQSLYGDDADTAYTQGDCDVFAVALERVLPEGVIVGIVDPRDDDGSEIEDAPPRLVHAGLKVGDVVIDVRGVHDRGEWAAEWLAKGSDDCEFDFLSREELEDMQMERMSDEAVEQAVKVARLIAIANGLEPDTPELEPSMAA